MRRRRWGPHLTALTLVALCTGLWLREKQQGRPASIPNAVSDSPVPPARRTPLEALNRRIAELEHTGASASDPAQLLESFGPRAPETARAAARREFASEADLSNPRQARVLLALLEADAMPEGLDLSKLAPALDQLVERDPTSLGAALEIAMLRQRVAPTPQGLTELRYRFTRALARLTAATRSGQPLELHDWALARAVFRSAPLVRDADLGPKLRHLHARSSELPHATGAASETARLEALAVAVVSGIVRGPSSERAIDLATARLLQSPSGVNDPSADEAPAYELRSLRALRLARSALFGPHPASASAESAPSPPQRDTAPNVPEE